MAKYKGVTVLEVLEGADRYNGWISERIRPYIAAPALEIGAGTGNISSFFQNLNSLTLTDSDEALVKTLRARFSEKKNISAELLDIQRDFSQIKNKFNTIFSINVLEHIKDDTLALRNMNKLLNKKGKVVILVPAKKIAFTNLDKDLGHFRRYEKQELYEKMEASGFKVKSISYFNVLGLLSWVVRDKISRGSKNLSPFQVKIFDMIVPVLRRIEPKNRLPMGISLIGIGEKI